MFKHPPHAKKIRGHVSLYIPPFLKIFKSYIQTVPGEHVFSNLKFLSLIILEQLALAKI